MLLTCFIQRWGGWKWMYHTWTTTVLTFITFWANSADDKLMIIFLFFPENSLWYFLQTVYMGDSLHEMQILFSGINKKKYFNV